MSESAKTGTFWGIALVAFLIGYFVSRPSQQQDAEPVAGRILFEKFTDPLMAANLSVTTFDEEEGSLDKFTVRQASDSGLWTIESKDDYPADALEQVTKGANALIGLKVLDVQTTNAEDHAALGVVEPDVTKLQVGDEGVGRLVTFRDKNREVLASIIIGDTVKGDEEKRYARIPGQDPVYVVSFDPSTVSTTFADWIEEDLLQLSSIDIRDVKIDDYEASVAMGGRFSLKKNYLLELRQDGSDWELLRLAEYGDDPLAEPTPVEGAEEKELDTTKINEMKNALDDLEFVNVFRKPKGVSASLQADADLVQDDETVMSLANRGFFPVSIGGSDQVEILSANGEMNVTTKEGVQYVLRFGNINSVDADDAAAAENAEDPESGEGVNRYLLVTTTVDESVFPIPDVQPVPKTVEELKENRRKRREAVAEAEAAANPASDDEAMSEPEASSEPKDADAKADPEPKTNPEPKTDEEPSEEASAESSTDGTSDQDAAKAEMSEPKSPDASSDTQTEPRDEAKVVEEVESEAKSGEAEAEGEATESGSGAGQDESAAEADITPEPSEPSNADDASADDASAEETSEEDGSEKSSSKTDDTAAASDEDDYTDEEWEELLEAEQEKITKANQQLIDARNDRIEAARRKVEELNARFADWYYVIPESTYDKLRIGREELFETEDESAGNADAAGPSLPPFDLPNLGQ